MSTLKRSKQIGPQDATPSTSMSSGSDGAFAQGREVPPAVPLQLQPVGVECTQRAAVSHADEDAVGQFVAQQQVQRVLESFVGGRRGLVEKDDARPPQQHACEGQALLFAKGQDLRPVRLVVEAVVDVPELNALQRVAQACVVDLRCRIGQGRARKA